MPPTQWRITDWRRAEGTDRWSTVLTPVIVGGGRNLPTDCGVFVGVGRPMGRPSRAPGRSAPDRPLAGDNRRHEVSNGGADIGATRPIR
jgi:hypothetical protein